MLKGLKTYIWNWLAGLLSVALIAMEVFSLPEFQAIIPQEALPFVLLAVALGNLWIRKKTDGPPRKVFKGTGNGYD